MGHPACALRESEGKRNVAGAHPASERRPKMLGYRWKRMVMTFADAKFEQFGVDHLGALAVLGAITAALAILLRRAGRRSDDNRTRRAFCWSLAILLPTTAIGEQIYEIATGLWSVQESLPLHLCDLGIVVTAAALIHARQPEARRSGRRWPRKSAGRERPRRATRPTDPAPKRRAPLHHRRPDNRDANRSRPQRRTAGPSRVASG